MPKQLHTIKGSAKQSATDESARQKLHSKEAKPCVSAIERVFACLCCCLENVLKLHRRQPRIAIGVPACPLAYTQHAFASPLAVCGHLCWARSS